MRLLTYRMPDELLAIASDGEFDEFDLNAFFEASGNRVCSVRLSPTAGVTQRGAELREHFQSEVPAEPVPTPVAA